MNVPNSVTTLGIVLVPLYVLSYLNDNLSLVVIFFSLICLSDFFDGEFARRLNQRTKFGALIDVIRDKLFFVAMVGNVFYIREFTDVEMMWFLTALTMEFAVWAVAIYACKVRVIILSVRLYGVSQMRQAAFLSLFVIILAAAYSGLSMYTGWAFLALFIVSLYSFTKYYQILRPAY